MSERDNRGRRATRAQRLSECRRRSCGVDTNAAILVARDALIEGRSDVLAKLGEEARAHLWACMQDLCERLTSAQRAAWPECPDVYIIHETGREKRFIRIVHVTKNVDGTENQRGCWAHVELSNGLVWDGGWKKPYDNYPRGCVLDEESREDLGARWAGLGGTKPYHEDLR